MTNVLAAIGGVFVIALAIGMLAANGILAWVVAHVVFNALSTGALYEAVSKDN